MSYIPEELRNEKLALECAAETLDFMLVPIGEPTCVHTIAGFTCGSLAVSEEYREKGEPDVARANSEWGKRWIKWALEHPAILNDGIPIYTLTAKQVESEKHLHEIIKNGSEWFVEGDKEKIEAGERDESSDVFIVPVWVVF